MDFNLSSIESAVDFIDDTADQLAPLVAPVLPEVALALPIVDGFRKFADLILASPLLSSAQAAIVTASVTQVSNAVNATPAS